MKNSEVTQEQKPEVEATQEKKPEEEPKKKNPTLAEKLYTEQEIKNCPTVFQALGMSQNRKVLLTLLGMSLLIAAIAFGVFFVGREMIPVWFPSISRYDSPIYACGACVVVTQVIIIAFYVWAWKHDVAEQKAEENKAKKE